MGGQISAVDALRFRQQGKRGTQPIQRNAAECFFAFAHACLGESRVILRKAEHAAVKALAVAVTLALNAVVKNMGGGIFVQKFKVFRVEHFGLHRPAGGKHRADVRADSGHQLFQPSGGIGGGI